MPFSKRVVITPTGSQYNGLKYQKGNCGVSIIRSGEAMEQVCIKYKLLMFIHICEKVL